MANVKPLARVEFTASERGRLLLAGDLHRAAHFLQFAPPCAEVARLRRVLHRLVDTLWPEPVSGTPRPHRNLPDTRRNEA